MRTLVALVLAALALAGCDLRLDAPDPSASPASADETLRQREALRAAELAAIDPADGALAAVAARARAQEEALGGVWRAWPAGDGPTPTVDPTADVAVGPGGVLPWLRATRPGLEDAVVDAGDPGLATLLAAVAIARAVDEDALARAAGEDPGLPGPPADLATTDPGLVRALDAAAHTLQELAARAGAAGEDPAPLAGAAESWRTLSEAIVTANGWAGTSADPREPLYDVGTAGVAEVDRDLALALLAAVDDTPDRRAMLDAAVGRAIAAARAGADLGALPGLQPLP